ncbi:MAG: SDR family oxidoreductase [Deltaproteobacteria bacterium]|nr:SDR family oxidoreductase [Deltaproteobacteria bacterium]
MNNLTGKVVVVTGGNSGIGFGMADGCAKAGADIAVWSRRADRNAEACAKLAKHGVRAVGMVCDVGSEASIVSATKDTLAVLGRIDACVASAGAPGYSKSLLDTTLADWHGVTRVSFDGLFLTFRECARAMIERGEGGALVAVSSTSAIHGAQRNHAYASSKTGLLGLTRALAVELARHKIRVNAILPGWTITEMAMGGYQNEKFRTVTTNRTPVRRWAEPSEFEAVGAYLCDPSLTFHTGDSLTVDGGYTIF